MDIKRNIPIGIELVRRGIVTESQVNSAVEYQRTHRNMKLGEILKETTECDEEVLIKAIADIFGEKGIALRADDITINIEEYISLDIAKECKAIPFRIEQGKIKVCFSDVSNKSNVDKIKLLLLNKGLVMEKYITFNTNIERIINRLEGKVESTINANDDIVKVVDSIIKTAMSKRASDVHFEPMDEKLRVRHRIDGELYTLVEIPKNVTELGDRVFSRCSNLREIYISSNITKIGISPFVDCSRLENIVVSEINPYYSSEDGILYNKSQSKLIQYPCGKSWKEYNVSNKVKIIGESAFMHCDSLRNITIPDNVEVIEDNAFKYSLNLTDVSIANSVKSLGARAFEKCKSLKRVKLSENIDSIKEYTFSECDSLIRITIPKQTKFIGNRAFFYCKQLSELYLSDSLRVIDEYAFNNCENLTTIELPQSVSKIG